MFILLEVDNMTYLYDCGNEVIKVWRNNLCETTVCVETTINGEYREFKRTVREDKKGKFFTWNKNKIYIDNFKKISIQSIKDKLANGEWITDDELCQAIMSEGVENVRFIIPMMAVSGRFMGIVTCDPTSRIDKVCHIEEGFNRNVVDNYKFNFVPDEYDGSTCSHEEYYVLDFVDLLRSGHAKIA